MRIPARNPHWLAAAALAAGLSAGAHELKDVSLIVAGGKARVELAFAPGPGESEFPLYFQKAEAAQGELTLSFLGTETAYSLGTHPLDGGAPGLEGVVLKKITSPSGKEFLGVGLKLRGADSLLSAGGAEVQAAPKGVLRLGLGKVPARKFSWSLSAEAKAADSYLAERAAPPPPQAEAKADEREAAAAFSAPVPPDEPAKAPPAKASGPASPSRAKAAEAAAPDPDPVASAHADGMALEKRLEKRTVGASKALSSSRIFTLAAGGKTLVLLKDSAALRSEPGARGAVLRKLPIGDSVARLAAEGSCVRVAAGGDSGWIRVSEAVYADELTEVQAKAIAKRIAANQARLAAAQARLAAQQAREEEKRRKAEEAAAEAARKLAEKQAAEEAKRQALAAANPPAGVQEAGAAPGRAGLPQAPGAPNASPAATGTAGPGPQLSLADNPELAGRLAREKEAADEEKKRIEPEENRVTYNSYGRRDPFIPVEQGVSDNGIDIDQMKVVGIIWQASQPMAVLEHSKESGISFTVKEGDPVHNGRVARISHDAVTFDISEYGISRSYSLRLVSSNAKEGAKR